MRAAVDAGVPLDVVDLDDPAAQAVYDRRLVLVRPDGHVAWSGDDDPRRPEQVIATISGHVGGVPAALAEAGAL